MEQAREHQMLLCTLVSSLRAVLGFVAVSFALWRAEFLLSSDFFFFPPTILMEKFEQSKEHQSHKWLIAFADYSAQANMEFFCPTSYFSFGRENLWLIFLPTQITLSTLTMVCGTGLSLVPRPITQCSVGFANPLEGLEGSLILSGNLLLAVGGYRPQLSPSHTVWNLHHPGFHSKAHLTT